jgi:hypothetical protein
MRLAEPFHGLAHHLSKLLDSLALQAGLRRSSAQLADSLQHTGLLAAPQHCQALRAVSLRLLMLRPIPLRFLRLPTLPLRCQPLQAIPLHYLAL